jgi:hypothetical protein
MLQIRQSRIRQIIVFVIVLMAWGVGVLSILFGSQVNWSQVFLGVTGGLIVWIFTYSVTNWIDPSSGVHYKTTTEIYDVVTRQYLSLVDKRRDAKDSKFYSQFYGSARTIKLSGIANQAFIEYILSKERRAKEGGGHLLQLMAKKPISVEVLLMDPTCDIISKMDEREPPGRKHVHFNNVVRILGMIEALYKEATEGNLRLAAGSKLDVRLSRIPLNTTLFYVDDHQDEGDGGNEPSSGSVLLMGMLYNHKDGDKAQLFRVPRDDGRSALYRDCIDHFDKTFELCSNEQILLLQSGNGPHFDSARYDVLKNRWPQHPSTPL